MGKKQATELHGVNIAGSRHLWHSLNVEVPAGWDVEKIKAAMLIWTSDNLARGQIQWEEVGGVGQDGKPLWDGAELPDEIEDIEVDQAFDNVPDLTLTDKWWEELEAQLQQIELEQWKRYLGPAGESLTPALFSELRGKGILTDLPPGSE